MRTDWLNVSVLSTIFGNPLLLLFQIWYLANWIFRSLFPSTQGAVTRFNPYGFLIICNSFNPFPVWTSLWLKAGVAVGSVAWSLQNWQKFIKIMAVLLDCQIKKAFQNVDISLIPFLSFRITLISKLNTQHTKRQTIKGKNNTHSHTHSHTLKHEKISMLPFIFVLELQSIFLYLVLLSTSLCHNANGSFSQYWFDALERSSIHYQEF